jgi:hypothetical protein
MDQIGLTAFFDVRISAGHTGNSLSSKKSYFLSLSTNFRGHRSVQSANDRRAQYAGHLLVDRASPSVRLELRHEYRANTAALEKFFIEYFFWKGPCVGQEATTTHRVLPQK